MIQCFAIVVYDDGSVRSNFCTICDYICHTGYHAIAFIHLLQCTVSTRYNQATAEGATAESLGSPKLGTLPSEREREKRRPGVGSGGIDSNTVKIYPRRRSCY